MARTLSFFAILVMASYGAGCSEGDTRELRFNAKPTAVKQGDKVKFAFSVSNPTDVEVAVLDASGHVVRHLAAGVLGEKNPRPEPLKAGLAQDLVWDGKDDFGDSANSGNRVRVRIGMHAELDGFIGESKCWIGELRGLATDPKKNLYVYSSSVPVHRGSSRYLQVFDRDGKNLCTIMPMPSNLLYSWHVR